MKKVKTTLFLAALILAFSTIIWAAGTVTETSTSIGNFANGYRVTTFDWTAASNGTLTAVTSSVTFEGNILQAITNPDTSASGAGPSDNYDITVTNSNGIDIFGGALANRDSTASEIAVPILTTDVYYTPVVNEKLIFALTNNSVNAARGKLIIYWSTTK